MAIARVKSRKKQHCNTYRYRVTCRRCHEDFIYEGPGKNAQVCPVCKKTVPPVCKLLPAEMSIVAFCCECLKRTPNTMVRQCTDYQCALWQHRMGGN